MTRLRLMVLLAALLAAPAAWPADGADLLDKAAACRRRAKPDCALEWAQRARAALTADDPIALRREAALVEAESLALLDRAEEAVAGFERFLTLQPEWRPPSDADPRVLAAVAAARRASLDERLPGRLEPPRPTLPPPVDPLELLPPPALYAPERLVTLDTDAGLHPRWRLSIGAGVALVSGRAKDRYDLGPTVALEIARDLGDHVALWAQLALTLLSFDGRVKAEPGEGRGLTVAAGVLGVQVPITLAPRWALVLAAGVGGGSFGTRSIGQAPGLALQGSAGIRWQLDQHLALRLDATPHAIIPIGRSEGLAGHVGIVARGEIRF